MKAVASSTLTARKTDPFELALPQGIRFSQNQIWEKRGRMARCQREVSFYPRWVENVAQIVESGRESGRQVRVATGDLLK